MTPAPPDQLDPVARGALTKVLELLAEERASVSSIVDERAWRVHVLDSLSGLEVPALRAAGPTAPASLVMDPARLMRKVRRLQA